MRQRSGKMWLAAALALGWGLTGCGSKPAQLDVAKTDAYARQVFDAVKARDAEAYLALCAHPGDVGVNGTPMLADAPPTWADRVKTRFDILMRALDAEGGTGTLQWVKPGQPLGYMKSQNEFVGNLYIEVTIGSAATPMALEIGSTQETQGRGRVLMENSSVTLLTWERYQAILKNNS